jgi:hypothetical protein
MNSAGNFPGFLTYRVNLCPCCSAERQKSSPVGPISWLENRVGCLGETALYSVFTCSTQYQYMGGHVVGAPA